MRAGRPIVHVLCFRYDQHDCSIKVKHVRDMCIETEYCRVLRA